LKHSIGRLVGEFADEHQPGLALDCAAMQSLLPAP
jgi:hypothetical protein